MRYFRIGLGLGTGDLLPPRPSLTSLQDKKYSSQDAALADQTWGRCGIVSLETRTQHELWGRLGADCVIRRLVGGGAVGRRGGQVDRGGQVVWGGQVGRGKTQHPTSSGM